MNLKNCKLVDLPKITDPEGNLTPIEGGRQVPFEIKRVFYLYDVPGSVSSIVTPQITRVLPIVTSTDPPA